MGLSGIDGLQSAEGLIHGQNLLRALGRNRKYIIEFDPLKIAATHFGIVIAGVIYQNAAHYGGRDCNKMLAVLPVDVVVGEAEVGFVDKSCRLQGVIDALAPHIRPGQSVQLGIDEGEQLLGRSSIATLHGA